ncbi:tRNA (adenosine(37)-N6)-threonylcarbamoyltransferase complex ATPase subunit type 1 TsaE [Vulcaniibacterium gelatinicum]|uniref:tRNA (adenosine(37)-N6)-threonylcarbamoyltransferase complex ATPase subunit type 1 TsaE n=1 Tax=Vulcaniibacterium gelatinicum TaxID=2598725 RepID=UPI0011C9F8B7|nr:tRNA (adenosine(37)-N6)-threonylcarbamoyltransferase complex ATPase subunit type 1 TsaE [Vulcaniibacterium gelatinicum]
MHLWLPDAEATVTLGRALAVTRPPAAVVYLAGDLGAGKSTLARALLRALGVHGPIRSPTYTLVERYPLTDAVGGEALHLDLYRIGDPGELEFLGLEPGEATLWLVEWPERGGDRLPPADLRIALGLSGEGREVRLSAPTEAGRAWLDRLALVDELHAFLVKG